MEPEIGDLEDFAASQARNPDPGMADTAKRESSLRQNRLPSCKLGSARLTASSH